MRIAHNMMSMYAVDRFNKNNEKSAKKLEKLSTGYKINRGADGAAELSISQKMRAELVGLKRVIDILDNAKNMCNVADGALEEDYNMLVRMEELAIQAEDGIYEDSDIEALQSEWDQLVEQIDEIAKYTKFNGITPLSVQSGTEEVDVQISTLSGTIESEIVDSFKANPFTSDGIFNPTAEYDGNTINLLGSNGQTTTGVLMMQTTFDAATSTLLGYSQQTTVTTAININEMLKNGQLQFNGVTSSGDTHTAKYTYTEYLKDANGNRVKDTSGNDYVLAQVEITHKAEWTQSGSECGWDSTFTNKVTASRTFTTDLGAMTVSSKMVSFMYLMDNELSMGSYSSEGIYKDNTEQIASDGVDTTGQSSYSVWTPELVDLGISEKIILGEKGTVDPAKVVVGEYSDIKDITEYSGSGIVDNTSVSNWGSAMYFSAVNYRTGGSFNVNGIGLHLAALSADNNLNGMTVTVEKPRDLTAPPSDFFVANAFGDDKGFYIPLCDATADGLGITGLSVSDSQNALKVLKDTIKKISEYRADFAAGTNRAEAAKGYNSVFRENLSAGESLIRDADMAREMRDYTNISIISQSSMAMLAQANTSAEMVLSLLQ